jgi:UDP-glucose 4-epimerase
MRVLVIGGNGFVGSHVVDALVAGGLDVTVYDRSFERYRSALSSVTYVKGDLGNKGELDHVLSKEIDQVIHLASSTIPKTSNDDPVFDVQSNLVETLSLLDMCVKHRVKRVIFTSSGGTVYGIPRSLPIPEEHATQPICSYGIVKLAIEKYLALYKHLYDLDYVVLRLANPYGTRQDPSGSQGAISVFMGDMLNDRPLRIWGDGSIVRDFVDVRDVARLYHLAVISDVESGTFNAGSGVGTSLRELIAVMAEELGVSPKILREPSRGFDVPTIVLDSEKAKRIFAWEPNIPLREGIREVAGWMSARSNRNVKPFTRAVGL